MAVKQRRQIVSMRDRAWGEFSLWGVVCMGGTCLVCFCELVFWCFAKCLRVYGNSTVVWSGNVFFDEDILERAKMRKRGHFKNQRMRSRNPSASQKCSLKFISQHQFIPILDLS